LVESNILGDVPENIEKILMERPECRLAEIIQHSNHPGLPFRILDSLDTTNRVRRLPNVIGDKTEAFFNNGPTGKKPIDPLRKILTTHNPNGLEEEVRKVPKVMETLEESHLSPRSLLDSKMVLRSRNWYVNDSSFEGPKGPSKSRDELSPPPRPPNGGTGSDGIGIDHCREFDSAHKG
jgi:hypothetical protein